MGWGGASRGNSAMLVGVTPVSREGKTKRCPLLLGLGIETGWAIRERRGARTMCLSGWRLQRDAQASNRQIKRQTSTRTQTLRKKLLIPNNQTLGAKGNGGGEEALIHLPPSWTLRQLSDSIWFEYDCYPYRDRRDPLKELPVPVNGCRGRAMSTE